MMNDETKKNVRTRLKRVEGQTAGLMRMVDDDQYCVDVLIQISAVQGALARIGEIILRSHIQTCVKSAFESGKPEQRQKRIDELMEVFSRYGRGSR